MNSTKRKIRIGIKYCGGCNPRFDRTAAVRSLMSRFPEAECVYDTSVFCPVWILICGCPNACAHGRDLRAGTTLAASSLKEVLALETQLKDILSYDTGSADGIFIRQLRPGDHALKTRTFTQHDLNQFAQLTGDTNGVHLDPATADLTLFRRPVVHGIFVSSLFSAILGTELPGNGTILLEETIQYAAPVYPGESITAELTFVSYTERKSAYIGVFEGACRKTDGTETARGTFRELMSKKLFKIS